MNSRMMKKKTKSLLSGRKDQMIPSYRCRQHPVVQSEQAKEMKQTRPKKLHSMRSWPVSTSLP